MDKFQRTGIKKFQSDARHSEDIHLPQEFSEIHSPFVIDISRTYQRDAEPGLPYSGRHVDILGEHFAETSHLIIYLAREAHVECPRNKLFHTDFSATDSTGGQEGGHGKVYGLLSGSKRFVCGIRASETVHGFSVKFTRKHLEIIFGNYTIAVEKHEIITARMLHAMITCYRTPFILLKKITDVDPLGCLDGFPARKSGAIFYNHYLKILQGLIFETTEKILYLIYPVVDRNYD